MNPSSKRRLQLASGVAVFAVAVAVSYFFTYEGEEAIHENTVHDVFLVIDTSSSMQGIPLSSAKKAASEFANTMYLNKTLDHKIGIISFSDNAVQIIATTNNNDALNGGINNLRVAGNTAMGDGIMLAVQMLAEQGRPETSKTIVLLSDGVSNAGISPHMAAQHASDAGVTIYSVGYGHLADVFTLKAVASTTNGDYFTASTGQDLAGIFDKIAQSLISPVSHYSSRVMMLVAIPILLFIPAIEAGLTTMMQLSDAPVKRNISKRKCPHCSHQNRQAAKFCLKCGKPLRSSEQPRPQPYKQEIRKQDSVTYNRCASCSYDNRQAAKFCLKCGKPLKPGKGGSGS